MHPIVLHKSSGTIPPLKIMQTTHGQYYIDHMNVRGLVPYMGIYSNGTLGDPTYYEQEAKILIDEIKSIKKDKRDY